MNLLIFLGSGVSLNSGLPSVDTLSSLVFSKAEDRKVSRLLEVLRALDSDYLANSAPWRSGDRHGFTGQLTRTVTTYEDLFYLCGQMAVNAQGLKADLSVEALTEVVRKRLAPVLTGRKAIEKKANLYYLVEAACKHIESTVAQALRHAEPRGLSLLVELARSSAIGHLTVATLNHDVLVEHFLQSENIEFQDGFGEKDGDVCWFSDSFTVDDPVQILKLHGSINWWGKASEGVIRPLDILSIDPTTWRNKDNEMFTDVRKSPSFLTGISKVNQYNRGIYADQHYRFQEALYARGLRVIIMSGYGWSDVPINFRILHWLAKHPLNRLILLHRNPEELVERAPELRHIYSLYRRQGKIVPLKRWLSETKIDDIVSHLQ